MRYTINFEPHIPKEVDYNLLDYLENSIKQGNSVSIDEINYFLNNLVYLVRNKININMDNFDYKCDLSQSILYHYLSNITSDIHPCMTQNQIADKVIGHSFLVVEFNVYNKNKSYIIDPTFIQFFKEDNCNISNFVIGKDNEVLIGPDPGYYVKEEDKEIITDFLNNGYMELNENTARIYGDVFLNTKQGRNYNDTYKSIPGGIYINSFKKGNVLISNSKEDLVSKNMLIDEISTNKVFNK